MASKSEWCARQRSFGVAMSGIFFLGMSIHTSGAVFIVFIILGISLLFLSLTIHTKSTNLYFKSSKHIRRLEETIYKKYKLIYCECTKGTHFICPKAQKIWNIKSNILFDNHITKRSTKLIFNHIEDPYTKISTEPSIIINEK